MDQKRRSILVIAIAITIMAGVISGFGLPFFFQNTQLSLPDLGTVSPPGKEGSGETNYQTLDITPEIVQEVIANMQRREQYYRELKIELFWGESGNRDSGVYSATVWNDGSYNRTTLMQPDAALRNALTADGRTYLWYGDDKTYDETPADASSTDLLQVIPSYEDVIDLPVEQITRAGFEDGCIFVEARVESLDYLERYWISTETGLLTAAETQTETGELLLYRMSEQRITELVAAANTFALPDGRILHSVVAP